MTPRKTRSEKFSERYPLDSAAAHAVVRSMFLVDFTFTYGEHKGNADSLGNTYNLELEKISEILTGNGNILISELAKILRASGYNLEISAIPIEGKKLPEIPSKRNKKKTIFKHFSIHEDQFIETDKNFNFSFNSGYKMTFYSYNPESKEIIDSNLIHGGNINKNSTNESSSETIVERELHYAQ